MNKQLHRELAELAPELTAKEREEFLQLLRNYNPQVVPRSGFKQQLATRLAGLASVSEHRVNKFPLLIGLSSFSLVLVGFFIIANISPLFNGGKQDPVSGETMMRSLPVEESASDTMMINSYSLEGESEIDEEVFKKLCKNADGIYNEDSQWCEKDGEQCFIEYGEDCPFFR